ncbi:M48 family metallopeptidase [Pseudoduganella sp. RAF53_2]|uniref:M48 family metallopeptidase n=1 Tax=unclassified Pseudoduganella TaxID=2637179 RepID=UPI003F96A980
MKRTLKHTVALLALAGFASVAPARQPETQQDGIPVSKLSPVRILADEETVDQQSKLQYTQLLQEAQKERSLIPATDPRVQRLRAIAKRIIPYTARWNPSAANWKWEVNLLDSDQVNAFCMPGGRIAFYTGILEKLNLTDDEVAMVMGHEISHALREHARKRMAESSVTSGIGKLLGAGAAAYFGLDPRVTDTVAGIGAQMVNLHFSRGEETEADIVGLDLASRAGFDPRAGVALWQKMSAASARQPMEFLSTHPSGETRINEMNKNLPLVLPVYARTRGLSVEALPPYKTTPLPPKA